MESIELIVSGSVAMTENGERVGKGEGYSDLEFAILREFRLVNDDTTTVTTVHEIQVVDEKIPTTQQDVPIDWIFTPKRTIRTEAIDDKPVGIEWSVLNEDRLDEIPILRRIESK
jgi:5-formyltetrahydrofolate cyclo-ligase